VRSTPCGDIGFRLPKTRSARLVLLVQIAMEFRPLMDSRREAGAGHEQLMADKLSERPAYAHEQLWKCERACTTKVQ